MAPGDDGGWPVARARGGGVATEPLTAFLSLLWGPWTRHSSVGGFGVAPGSLPFSWSFSSSLLSLGFGCPVLRQAGHGSTVLVPCYHRLVLSPSLAPGRSGRSCSAWLGVGLAFRGSMCAGVRVSRAKAPSGFCQTSNNCTIGIVLLPDGVVCVPYLLDPMDSFVRLFCSPSVDG